MASVVCAPRNETTRLTTTHQSRSAAGFMGKIPFLNNNPNPNPNPKNSHPHPRKQFPHQNGDEFPTQNPTASDDASSFSHRRPSEADAGSFSHYVSFDISGYSRSELRSLKTRLMSELDRVRSLSTRIESGDVRNGPNPKKRPMPFQNPSKEAKRFASCSNGKAAQQQPVYVATAQVMKLCSQVLTKLMKQKAGYVFNTPVDVVGLGLHDYHQIIQNPMDLGTIKTNLLKNAYPTPEEFAADVRLTFNNALLYNPKGHEVHNLAEQFLARFEQLFRPVYHKYMTEKQQQTRHQQRPDIRPKDDIVVVDEVVQGSSWSKNNSNNPSPEMVPRMMNPNPIPPKKQVEAPRVEPAQPRLDPVPPPAPAPAPAPVHEVVAPAPVKGQIGRGPSGKLPKPKAKDPNKREMTMEEKHKLGAGLQSLPEEKMTQVLQIIGKRSGGLAHNGDEIELDIEAVDTETLWELDRFVTNYKKMVSKIRRQALIMPPSNVGHPDTNQASVSERVVDVAKARKGGGGDVGEEDVDIGDEMPVNNFPPLEIEKDDDRQQQQQQGGASSSSSSSSSSSGSDSSSSSDSDSGSSSGSDSDVDDAQSRDNESKNVHH